MINDDSRTDDELNGDESIAQPFDQTNGLVDGLEGDSDGTAQSDTASAGERGDDDDIADPGEGSAALFRGQSG